MGCCVSIEDPHERALAEYRQSVTPEIALHKIHSYLIEHGARDKTHREIFDACSVKNSPQEQPYWTTESFRNHITAKFPGASIPDTAVDVLWSCFCFYAWHPFPNHGNVDTQKLARPEFERALILLAYKGTGLLGTMCGKFGSGPHWAYVQDGRPCTCRQNVDRILRSISQLSSEIPDSNQTNNTSASCIKDDMMDVVATTEPYDDKGIPGPDELAPSAQLLLDDKSASYHSRLQIEHFTTIMRMLMRVNLLEPTWSQQKLHYGTLEEPTPQQDELVNILAAQFQLSEGFIVQESLSRAFDILPNFELHFHQLWALIFQPPIPETSSLSRAESQSDSTIRDILRAVSLFVPPATEFHGKPERHRDIRPVSFETTYQSLMRDSNSLLALPHIIKGLTKKETDHRPHLVLFLGDKAQSHSYIPGIMGALYAAAPKREGNGEQDVSETVKNFELAPLQLLFQLQPNPRMFRLKEGGKVPQSLSNKMAQSHAQDHAAKYWMRDHQESEVGLQIDPTRNRVAFVLNDHGANQSEFTYNDVLRGNGGSETLGKNQGEVIRESFTVSQIIIYRVDGGDKFEPWSANKDGVIRRI